jgi:apolipoprotein N-acyltransferase
LIPLIKFLYQVENKKQLFSGLFLFSFLAYSFLMSWLLSTDVFAWFEIPNFLIGKIVILAYLIYFVLICCVTPFLILFYLFYKFKTKTFWDIFLFSSLWVLFDYSRTFIHPLAYYEENSFFGEHDTFCSIGYIFASSENFLQLARFGGVYLLGFVIVFINFAIYWMFFKSNKIKNKSKIIFLFLLIIAIFLPFNKIIFKNSESKNLIRISSLEFQYEPNISENKEELEKKHKNYFNILMEIEKSNFNPRVIIFPEGFGFNSILFKEKSLSEYYENFFSDKKKIIIDSDAVYDSKKVKSRLFYYNVEENLVKHYDKMFLTPGTEFLPVYFKYIAKLFNADSLLERFLIGGFSKGEELTIGDFGNLKIGGIFCLELVSPKISRDMTINGAQFFVNPSSHGSFKGNLFLRNQIVNIMKTRAVENDRYFVLSGNYVNSLIISNKHTLIMINNKYVLYFEQWNKWLS